ncbi:MAG TPA: MlaD family protein [Chlamydiales bacterium]|nr:MlaD family protein [Chlamydiales bacterium]
MNEKIKTVLIGLFVMASVAIAVSMIFFLKPQIGDGKKILRVRFANISGIMVGTRVAFAGKPVGEVIHITEIPDARAHPDELGRVYFYELILKTDSSVEIYDSDEIAVRSIGLMGEKSVAILPKAGKNAALITHEIIYANSIDPLDNTFTQISKAANRLEAATGHVDAWIESYSDALGFSIQMFNQTMSRIDEIMSDFTSAKGTLGRLIAKDDFYLHLTSLISKAETMMNDINHYGILFQYDKHWQRSRTKKANLLKALDSPKEFKAYFDGEIDAITTSLGRLTELLEKAEMADEKIKIAENESFKKQFAALLRHAQSLTDTIKLYNQGLSLE